MKINEKGLGEIIDEAITLSFKIVSGIKTEESAIRFIAISEFITSQVEKNPSLAETAGIVVLILSNATCWFCQDKIMSTKDNFKVAEYAKRAQELNVSRNKLIGLLNKGQGIITEKSYNTNGDSNGKQ